MKILSNIKILTRIIPLFVILSGCRNSYHHTYEINDVSKEQAFRVYIYKEHDSSYYFSKISGDLDGEATISRAYSCSYSKFKNCNFAIGSIQFTHQLKKGKVMIGDSTDFYGGDLILRYKPITAKKGSLKIQIQIPSFALF